MNPACPLVLFCYSNFLRQNCVDHVCFPWQDSGPCCESGQLREHGITDAPGNIGSAPGRVVQHLEPGLDLEQDLMTTLPPPTPIPAPPAPPAPAFISGESHSRTTISITIADYVLLIILSSVVVAVSSLFCHCLCLYGVIVLKRRNNKLRRQQREKYIKLKTITKSPSTPADIINDGVGNQQLNGNNSPPPPIVSGAGSNIEENNET